MVERSCSMDNHGRRVLPTRLPQTRRDKPEASYTTSIVEGGSGAILYVTPTMPGDLADELVGECLHGVEWWRGWRRGASVDDKGTAAVPYGSQV